MKNANETLIPKEKLDRLIEIDYVRGFTIILLVFVNFIASARNTPDWLKHAKDIGLTITDLVAPAFIFAIGITYKNSFTKRINENGINKAYSHFITRFLAIIGIGTLFTAAAYFVSPVEAEGSWGVVQAIGAAGLITLFFIRFKTILRLFISILLLLIYQIVLDKFFLSIVLKSAHGGLFASLSWSSLLIISTILADLFYEGKHNKYLYLILSFLLLTSGLFLSKYFPISKHRVSISYIFISCGISGVIFYLFFLISKLKSIRLNFLIWWGMNPLFLYILHMLLLGVTFIPFNQKIFLSVPFYIILLQFIIFFSILSFSSYVLYKKKIFIKI